jgi:Apea-like HEPN
MCDRILDYMLKMFRIRKPKPLFSFRIRFNRSPNDTIQTETNEITLFHESFASPLRLHNPDKESSILNAKQLALTGDGYTSLEEALIFGERYQHALIIALAKSRIGADFGMRSAKGFFTNHGLAWLEGLHKRPVLNNIHGLMAFATDPKPSFASSNPSFQRGVNQQTFEHNFINLATNKLKLNEREMIAFSLFNASFFQQTVESRFLLLMMAIESMLEPKERPNDARLYVEQIIEQTKGSKLAELDKTSIIGSLRWLSNESISQTGKRLAESRLGKKLYNELSAPRFFTDCYSLRSKLVHGSMPYPTFEELSGATGALEVFVADLLTSPFLEVSET